MISKEVKARLRPGFTLWPLKGRRTRSAGVVGGLSYGVTVGRCEGVPKLTTEQEGDLP